MNLQDYLSMLNPNIKAKLQSGMLQNGANPLMPQQTQNPLQNRPMTAMGRGIGGQLPQIPGMGMNARPAMNGTMPTMPTMAQGSPPAMTGTMPTMAQGTPPAIPRPPMTGGMPPYKPPAQQQAQAGAASPSYTAKQIQGMYSAGLGDTDTQGIKNRPPAGFNQWVNAGMSEDVPSVYKFINGNYQLVPDFSKWL